MEEKGKKRGKIGKILASEASRAVAQGGEREAEPGDMSLMTSYHAPTNREKISDKQYKFLCEA